MYRATLPGFKTHIAKQSVLGGQANALLAKHGALQQERTMKKWAASCANGTDRARRGMPCFLCAANHMQMVGPNALNDRAHCAG